MTLLYSVCCTYAVHIVSALLFSVDFSGPERFVLFLSFSMNLLTHAVARQSFVNNESRSTSILNVFLLILESESELFTRGTSKDNHSPGPVVRRVSP